MSAALQFRPGALWSLWEMIGRYGDLVAICTDTLLLAEQMWSAKPADAKGYAITAEDELLGTFTGKTLLSLRQLCIYADWDALEPQIARLESRLYYAPAGEISRDFRALHDRMRDDLKAEHFFHVSLADVPLYASAEPFGEKVSKRFPKAIEDIAEAAKCLALQRPTASVFHLMRVMELAIRSLAKKLKVTTIDPNVESWNKITDHVNRAINALPGKTASEQTRKARFGAASAHLNSVRVAWRNEVMHPKQTYSREEAHVIFAAVRAFMVDLAALK